MFDISAKKALNSTIIEIDSDFLNTILFENADLIANKYVPPLFNEFCIKIKTSESTYNKTKNLINSFGKTNKNIKKYNIDDFTELIYIKYHSATNWSIIYFEQNGKKKIISCDCCYLINNDASNNTCYAYTTNKFTDKYNNEIISNFAKVNIAKVLCLSEYIQNLNNFVEYEKIEVSKPEKVNKTNVQNNKGYQQKIKLKSKYKKYIVSDDTVKLSKKYQKIKPCWYVRGYYQHFGKDKIIKYIPPRINYRQNEKDADVRKKPKSNNYVIVNDIEKGD